MAQKMYVDVNEIMKDWGCSRAKGYQIIAELNAQLGKEVKGFEHAIS